LHVIGHAVHQRHFDEDQWFVRHAQMKKPETPPVRLKSIFEIFPTMNTVDSFVFNQLL
jgi:hypothetical protein